MLGFDLVIALVTFVRVGQTNLEETLAMHGMNRIRAAYVRIAPEVDRFFVSGTTDDFPGIMKSYRVTDVDQSLRGNVVYGLSTSLGLVGLVTAMLAGLLGGVIGVALGVGTVGAIVCRPDHGRRRARSPRRRGRPRRHARVGKPRRTVPEPAGGATAEPEPRASGFPRAG